MSDVLTILIAPLLAVVALGFGPSERFWLMTLAITLLGALGVRNLSKGMFSAAIGIYFGTIGQDPVSAVSRNTFGLWWLSGGIALIPMVIGVFAMGRMLEEAVRLRGQGHAVIGLGRKVSELLARSSEGLSLREYLRCWKEMATGLGVAKQVSPRKRLGSGVCWRAWPRPRAGTMPPSGQL